MVVLGLVLLGPSACASTGERAEAASAVAVRLLTSVKSGDGAAACAALAPDTAAELEKSAEKPCAAAVLEEDLPAPAEVISADVYGQRAQVVLADDTVFLAMFPGGWRVVAAGCSPRADRPYDCTIQGG